MPKKPAFIPVRTDSSDPDKVAIFDLYWERDDAGEYAAKTSELACLLGAPVRDITKLAEEVGHVEVAGSQCPACGKPSIARNRSQLQARSSRFRSSDPCSSCVAQANRQVALSQQSAAATARATFLEHIEARAPIDSTAIGWPRLAVLLALLRHSASESIHWIRPLSSNRTQPLCATPEASKERLISLYHAGVIVPDPSAVDLVTPDPGSREFLLPLLDTPWRLSCLFEHEGKAVDATNYPREFLAWLNRAVLSPEGGEGLRQQIAGLAHRLVTEEAEAYLALQLADRRFPVAIGDKTKSVISEALDNFSLGQFFCFAWMACRNAADFYQRNAVNQRHAANTVPGSLMRYMDRAISTDWEVTTYRRNFDLPVSAFNELILCRLLGSEDSGLSVPVRGLVASRLGRPSLALTDN